MAFQSGHRTLQLVQSGEDLDVFAPYIAVKHIEPAGQVIDSSSQADQRILALARLTVKS